MTTQLLAHRTFRFADGDFRFYVASFGSWANDAHIVFRVRIDRDPHERAAEKAIRGYDRVLPLKLEGDLVARWLISHPDQRLLEVLDE